MFALKFFHYPIPELCLYLSLWYEDRWEILLYKNWVFYLQIELDFVRCSFWTPTWTADSSNICQQLNVSRLNAAVTEAIDERVVETVSVTQQDHNHIHLPWQRLREKDVQQNGDAVRQPGNDVDEDDKKHGDSDTHLISPPAIAANASGSSLASQRGARACSANGRHVGRRAEGASHGPKEGAPSLPVWWRHHGQALVLHVGRAYREVHAELAAVLLEPLPGWPADVMLTWRAPAGWEGRQVWASLVNRQRRHVLVAKTYQLHRALVQKTRVVTPLGSILCQRNGGSLPAWPLRSPGDPRREAVSGAHDVVSQYLPLSGNEVRLAARRRFSGRRDGAVAARVCPVDGQVAWRHHGAGAAKADDDHEDGVGKGAAPLAVAEVLGGHVLILAPAKERRQGQDSWEQPHS